MVTRVSHPRRRQRGALTTDLVVAMSIFVVAVLPMAYSFLDELRVMRATVVRAAAMELVDGEMEILAAGEWRAWPEGTQAYTIQSAAVTNLPSGDFRLTRTGKHLRLEWRPEAKLGSGPVIREVTLK